MPYVAPNTFPATTICKRINVPNDPLIRAAVNGAILSLSYDYNWETSEGITAKQMADLMWPYVDEFLLSENCDEGTEEEGDCTQYPPNAPFFAYAPNDPFQTPEYLPDGYAVPPWYNNPLIPLPGVQPGDAMVNFLAFPAPANWPGIVTTGFPRVRLFFTGSGQVEVEFVKVVQGGYAFVVLDDNPTTQTWVDCTSVSLIGLSPLSSIFGVVVAGELTSTDILEVMVTTAGDHHLDITFVPKIDETVLLGFGGGIRRVSLCGVDIPGEAIVPQMRPTSDGCGVEWRPHDATPWVLLIDDICGEDGAPGTPGTPGADGINGLDGTDGLDGAPGTDGASAELRVVGNHLQWRQSDDSPTWTFLYDLFDLNGEDGEPGADGASFGSFISPAYRCQIASEIATRWVTNIDNTFQYARDNAGGIPQAVLGLFMGWSPAKTGWAAVATNIDAMTNAEIDTALTYLRLSTTIPAWTCVIIEYMDDAGRLPTTGAEIIVAINDHIQGNVAAGTARTRLTTTVNATNNVNLIEWAWYGWVKGDPGEITADCDPCMTETGEEWGRIYNFATGSRSTSFSYVNNTRNAGSGYRQTSGAAPVTFSTSNEVFALRVQVTVAGGIGDGGTLKLFDLRTGDEVANWDVDFTFEAVVQVFTWEGENLPFLERGFRVEWDGSDEGDGSFQYVQSICIYGVSLIIPPEGSVSGCTDV